MSQLEKARAALRGRIWANRAVALGIVLLAVMAAFFWFRGEHPREHALRMTGGDPLSHRHQLAVVLCEEAKQHGLVIELTHTAGSQEALAKIADDTLDVALVLGDFDIPDEEIRQIAALNDEALHVFVRPELLDGGVAGLRGKTLSLSNPGSNTHKAAHRLLNFIGLQAGRDFVEKDYSHAELLTLTDDNLPDAIFAITSLPWTEVGESLVKKHGFRLMELPMAEAVALRNPAVHDTVIPAFSYGIDPPVPARPLHTVGQRLLVVASRTTPDAAIERLMRVLFESEFGRRARLPSLDPNAVDTVREFPLHTGAVKYLNRNQPLIKADSIDKIENLRSFLVSAGLAIFLFWRWHKRRNLIGFETYIDAVSEIELTALTMERQGTLDFAELRRLRGRLSEQKNEALERESEGALSGDEQMNGFLAHVLDVRTYLDSLLSREPLPQSGVPMAQNGEPPKHSPSAAGAQDESN